MEILLGNTLNAFGAVLAISATYFFGRGPDHVTTGFKCSIAASFLIFPGSIMLGSYPVALLNVGWLIISLVGLHKHRTGKSQEIESQESSYAAMLLLVLLGSASYFSFTGDFTTAAYIVMFSNLTGYFIFSTKRVNRGIYLLYCFFLSLSMYPHLIEYSSYSIMAKDILSTSLALYGGIKYFVDQKEKAR